MTLFSVRPDEQEARPANDNRHRTPASAPADLSILDLIPADGDAADIARRAERLGNAVVIVIAFCLIVVPATYLVLTNWL